MIRQFQAHDASACSELIRQALMKDEAISKDTCRDLLARETPEYMLERGRLFYIAVSEIGGSIAGLGGVEMNEIRLLLVGPQYRGCGIGRSLLKHLEALVPPGLFTDVFVYASPGAVEFYRSQQYAALGEHSFQCAGFSYPTVFMVKDI